MAVSRGATPARHGSPMRATTPARAGNPGVVMDGMPSPAKNAVANESRPRLLGGMTTIPPLPKAGKPEVKHAKAKATVPQTSRETRTTTNKLPGKPDRLAEGTMYSTPTKPTTKKKRTPKKTTARAAATTATATPKVLKPKATKLTKNNKSSVKPKARGAVTAKKGAAAAAAAAATTINTTKGKRRPCMVEEPLPRPVGYDDHPGELSEACKRGVYRASQGWFDLTKMRFLRDEEVARFEKETKKTMRAHPAPPPRPRPQDPKNKELKTRVTSKAKTGAGVKKNKSSPAKKVAATTKTKTTKTPKPTRTPTPKKKQQHQQQPETQTQPRGTRAATGNE